MNAYVPNDINSKNIKMIKKKPPAIQYFIGRPFYPKSKELHCFQWLNKSLMSSMNSKREITSKSTSELIHCNNHFHWKTLNQIKQNNKLVQPRKNKCYPIPNFQNNNIRARGRSLQSIRNLSLCNKSPNFEEKNYEYS